MGSAERGSAERRDALMSEAALRLSQWFEWELPPGGMFVRMRSKNRAIDTCFSLQWWPAP